MSALNTSLRPLRLIPRLVRFVVPQRHIGTYALHRDARIVYVGRSDDLRRRLVEHAGRGRADFFTFDIHRTSMQAFEAESAMFHSLSGSIENLIHPAPPAHSGATCPFCRSTVAGVLTNRFNTGPCLDHVTCL